MSQEQQCYVFNPGPRGLDPTKLELGALLVRQEQLILELQRALYRLGRLDAADARRYELDVYDKEHDPETVEETFTYAAAKAMSLHNGLMKDIREGQLEISRRLRRMEKPRE